MADVATNSIPVGLQSISIKDFRGIADLELSFLDARKSASEIAVLAGPNGSGKTTVLHACLIALGHTELIPGSLGKDAIRIGSQGHCTITADFQTGHGLYRSTYGNQRGPQIENLTKNLASLPAKVPCLFFSSWRTPKMVGPVGVTAGRAGSRPDESEINRLKLTKQYLVNARVHAFIQLAAKPEGPSLYETAIDRLNSIWNDFYPGRKLFFTVEAVSPDPQTGFDVYLNDQRGNRISVDSLRACEKNESLRCVTCGI